MTRCSMLVALAAALTLAGAAPAARAERAVASPTPGFRTEPPPPAFPADSADSLYRAARQALNDGGYARAAELFARIAQRFPGSRYAPDALYWRAFALYRDGGSGELRDALAALDQQAHRYPDAATHGDAAALATRIRGELARRGDRQAAESVVVDARDAAQGCPSEGDDMRVAALNALMQMDADQALPILRKVLARRDACSEHLREKALFLVAQKESPATADILVDAARNDPAPSVRRAAVFWLGQVHGDRAVPLLDSLLRSTHDEELQDRAVFALSQQSDPRAERILRQLVSSPATSEHLKGRAIFALGQMRGDTGDMTELRQLFGTLRSESLKEQVLLAVSQHGDSADRKWLLDIALDPAQSMEVRKRALFWVGQQQGAVAELVPLYDRATDRDLKEQIIFSLAQSDSRAATDKLIDIARHGKDRELRKKAIFWLGQRDDPRVRQLLEELIANDSTR